MKTIQNLAYVALLVAAMNAQTPTQMDVSRVKGAAQLGADGKVVASQLPPSGGSGGSGASQTAQLLDWKFTRVSATQLRFGDNCLPSSPCNVDIGGTVSPFTDGPYLINLSGAGASGSICVYVSPLTIPAVTVGVGAGLTTANITASTNVAVTGNVNSCPQDAAKLEKWDVAVGAFNSTGIAYASYLSYKPSPVAGTGIQIVTGQRDSIQVDTVSVLRKYNCAGGPAAALPSGATQGDVCWDFNPATPAKYVCANPAGCTVAGDWKAF